MRWFGLWWLVPVALAILLPHTVSAHSPSGVQVTSPGIGVHYLRPGAVLNVSVQYTSQPAIAGSTAVRVELFHQVLHTVVDANTVTVPDGVDQQAVVPLGISPGTPETSVYRLRARVTNSDNPESDYTTTGGVFAVDAGPPNVEVMMPGAGDAPVQPLSSGLIQVYGRIADVSTGMAVRTEVALAGSGAWSQTAQEAFFPSPIEARQMGLIQAAGLADGSYDLRVTVTDGAGYQAVRQTTFTLEETPTAAPNPPRNLQVEPMIGAVRLHWSPPAGGAGVQSYQVKRNGVVVAETLGATSALVVTPDANITYQVVAVNSVGVSAPVSLEASPLSAPPPPPAVAVFPQFGWNEVTWMYPAEIPPGVIVRYRIHRDGVLLAERDSGPYYDNSAVPGVTYEYRVTAFTTAGESVPSPGATVATWVLPDPPGVPAPAATTDPAGTVTLTWSTVANMADPGWDVYDIYRDGEWQEYLPYPASTWKDFTAVPGTTYTYSIDACNATSCTDPVGVTITAGADTALPTGTVSIHSGGVFTANPVVSLSLSATDNTGVTAMRFSAAGHDWTEWQPYSNAGTYTLPAGDGSKAVFVQFRDAAGNIGSATDTIVLDTTAPVGVAGALPNSSPASVAIAWTAEDGGGTGVVGVTLYYSADGGQTWMPYGGNQTTSPIPFVAPATGSYAFSITAVDAAGNAEATPIGAAAVEASTEVPGAAPSSPIAAGAVEELVVVAVTVPSGQVAVNGGDLTTRSPDVTLNLESGDATEMRFANDGDAWGSWEPYRATRPYRLPEGFGRKAVFVQFRNAAGVSATVSDDILVVDEEALLPRGSVLINAGAPVGGQRDVELTFAVQYGPFRAGSLRLSDDGTTWTDWEAFREQRNHTLPSGDGRKTVYVQFRDLAGNYLASAQIGTVLDTTPPAGLVVLETVSPSEAQVHALAHDRRSGVTEMRYSTNGTDWTDWTPYRPVWRVLHPVEPPPLALRVQFRDQAGNVGAANVARVPGLPPTAAQIPAAVPVPARDADADAAVAAAPPQRAAQLVTVAPMIPFHGSTGIEVQWSTAPWLDGEVTAVRLYYTTDGGVTWAAYGGVFQSSPIPFVGSGAGTYGFAVRPERVGLEEPAGPADIQAVTRLDLTPPTANFCINAGAVTTARDEVLLLLAAADAGAGVAAMRFSGDNKNWTGWEAYRPVRRWVLSPGTGMRTVFVQFQDQAGNSSEPVSASIRLEPDLDSAG